MIFHSFFLLSSTTFCNIKSFCHFPLNHVSIDVNIPKDALWLEREQLEKKLNPAGQSLTQSAAFWVENQEKAALAGWRQLCSKLVRRSHHCGRRLVAPCSTGAPLSPPVQHSSVPGKQGGAGHATLIHNVLLSYFQAVVWTRPLVCMAVHVRLLAPSLAHLHQMFKPSTAGDQARDQPGKWGAWDEELALVGGR